MRSNPYKEFDSIRERLAERRAGVLLHKQAPVRRICRFDHDSKRLLRGHGSLHQTKPARLWRCRLRIKRLIHG